MSHRTEDMTSFMIFLPILAKICLPWQRLLHPCNQKCLLWIGRPRKPRVISNHIFDYLLQKCIYSLVPKLVAMVKPLCAVCTEVSQMNLPIAQTLCQNQTLRGYVAYNWSYAIFVRFLPILTNICCHCNIHYTGAIRNVFLVLADHENPQLEVITFLLSLAEVHL